MLNVETLREIIGTSIDFRHFRCGNEMRIFMVISHSEGYRPHAVTQRGESSFVGHASAGRHAENTRGSQCKFVGEYNETSTPT